MKMKKILKLTNPIITTIPTHSNFLSIAMLSESGNAWLCSNYINIYLRYTNDANDKWHDSCKANFVDWGSLDRNYSNVVESFFVPRFIVQNDIIRFVINSIENGYYLIMRLDQYYMPFSASYLKEHYPPCVFINGIDCDEDKVYISAFIDNGKYRTVEIDFSSFKESFINVENEMIPSEPDYQFFRTEIQLLRPQINKYSFSIKHCLALLKDFLECKDSTGRFFNTSYMFEPYNKVSENIYLYGLDCINKIGELFCDGRFGIQNVHLLYDRYRAMTFRLNYLRENLNIQLDNNDIICEYKEIEHNALTLRNMCLKYQLTGKYREKEKILVGFERLKELEKRTLENLILEIDKYVRYDV